MLHSTGSEAAAKIGKRELEKHYQKTLTAALGGEQAGQRAALVFALVAGFQVMRQMIGLSALADADPEELVKLLEPLFALLVDQPG